MYINILVIPSWVILLIPVEVGVDFHEEEIGGIAVFGADESQLAEIGHGYIGRSVIDTFALWQQQQKVKQLEQLGRGLMDAEDDGAACK